MNNPFISIIIPVYNAEHTLKECLSAICASNYKNYELIVVDDFSGDNSLNIIKNFSCRIIKLKKNRGPAAARNKGASKAVGDMLLFVDSDIIINNDTVRRLVISMKGRDAVTGIYTKIPYNNTFFSLYQNYYAHENQKKTSSLTCLFHTACGIIRKDVFIKLGGFNENIKRATIDDVEFGYRLSEKGYRIYLDKGIRVSHFTNYTFLSLIKSYYYKSRDWAELLVIKGKGKHINEGWPSIRNILILLNTILMLFFILLSLCNSVFLFFILACIALFIYFNYNFYMLVLKEIPSYIISGIFIGYLINFILFFGICTGILGGLKKKSINKT